MAKSTKRWKHAHVNPVCKRKFRDYKKFTVYDDLIVRDQAPSCSIYISCGAPIQAEHDSSLVGVQNEIVGCSIT